MGIPIKYMLWHQCKMSESLCIGGGSLGQRQLHSQIVYLFIAHRLVIDKGNIGKSCAVVGIQIALQSKDKVIGRDRLSIVPGKTILQLDRYI